MLPDMLAEARPRIEDGTFPEFWKQLNRIAGCTRPIRLSGHINHVDTATGEIRPHFDSATKPDGTILIPCGNRRASVCPSCSWTYAGDAWQIVHAGLAGGRDVPDSVTDHPGLFVTVTAPSFGQVHTRNAAKGQPARTCHRRRGLCPHGNPIGCLRTHRDEDDPMLGQALCLACYDFAGAVLWNATAPRLFKRTVDLAYRRLAAHVGLPILGYTRRDGTRRIGVRDLVRISYVKVAEGQARCLIHYHAVLRLDGVDRDDPDAWPEPPTWATGKLLASCWRWAVDRAREPCPNPAGAGQNDARWGEQHDEKYLVVAGGAELDDHTALAGRLDAGTVGNYLAKYVTKDLGAGSALARPIRSTADLFGVLPYLTPHQAAMVQTAWDLGGRLHVEGLRLRHTATKDLGGGALDRPIQTTADLHAALASLTPRQAAKAQSAWNLGERLHVTGLRLRANAHQYGFRGHWLTKSRRYSTTFGACRQARRDWARTHDGAGNPRTPLDAWNRPLEDDTGDEVIAIGDWTFEGAGYRLPGDAQLAAMAADLARIQREAARDAAREARAAAHA
ncbi:replication initiator [Candidatus Frankia nodulisporulans]|uniref:replication initiator n=1 Tax=Candidatus Frankia nodulisporulans TaxID=2060052 RepID=UPI0013D0C6A5|nr:replication initiator [Candidatus Frankia nodulisporulans]